MIDHPSTTAGSQLIDVGIEHLGVATFGTSGRAVEHSQRVVVIQIHALLDISGNGRRVHRINHHDQLDRDLVPL
jgi:hypothetical protein